MPANRPEYARVRVAFSASAFFGDLPATTLDQLARSAVLERFEQPAFVVKPGDDGDRLWLVLEGAMLACWTSGHGPVPIAMLGPGSFYNSAAFVEGESKRSIGRVEARSVLASIPGPTLRRLVEQDRELSRCVARLLLHRFQAALSYYADTISVPLSNRIARRLIGQAMASRRESEAVQIELRTSQSQLARIVGAGRSKVNAELRQMEKQGLLRLGYRTISVIDLGGLCGVAGGQVPPF